MNIYKLTIMIESKCMSWMLEYIYNIVQAI